jgi:beta-lactamase class A
MSYALYMSRWRLLLRKAVLLAAGLFLVLCITFGAVLFLGLHTASEAQFSQDLLDVQTASDRELVAREKTAPSELSEAESGSQRVAGEGGPFAESAFTTCAEQTYYGVLYFDKDILYSSNNSAQTPSASVIKVFIMEYAFSLVSKGELASDALMGGSTLDALVRTMIQDSNNDATNTLIEVFGMEALNAFFASKGYADTALQRRMLDYAARAAGRENYTSLNDCLSFLETLYQNRAVYPYSEMLEIMKGQNVRTKIPMGLPYGISVANKTGELDDVENDIGIVFSEESDFALVALTYRPFSTDGARSAIAELARVSYEWKE